MVQYIIKDNTIWSFKVGDSLLHQVYPDIGKQLFPSLSFIIRLPVTMERIIMEEKQYINKIVTLALNTQYFVAGRFYVVLYPDGAQYLTVCTAANAAEGVKLTVVQLLKGELAYHSGAGKVIGVDNKNLGDFKDILRYDVGDFECGSFGGDLSLKLKAGGTL